MSASYFHRMRLCMFCCSSRCKDTLILNPMNIQHGFIWNEQEIGIWTGCLGREIAHRQIFAKNGLQANFLLTKEKGYTIISLS